MSIEKNLKDLTIKAFENFEGVLPFKVFKSIDGVPLSNFWKKR